MASRVRRLFDEALARLSRAQALRPFAFLAGALALVALGLVAASRLQIQHGLEPLLPRKLASVRELHRVADRTAGISTLLVVLELPPDAPRNDAGLRAAGDALVGELRAIGEPYVGSAADGIGDALAYVRPRAGLYASVPDLEGLRADVDARWQYEVAKAGGLLLDDATPPPPLDADVIRARLHASAVPGAERFPDGYFQSEDGHELVVVVRSKVLGNDTARAGETIDRVRAAIDRVDLRSYDPALGYGLSGDLYREYIDAEELNRDLLDVGLAGAALIAGVVLLYYLRARMLVVMLLTIGVSLAWTAGVARLLVGHLNLATGFVFTIVAGNGLNPAVIYMARFIEERRAGRSLGEGIEIAHRETIGATFAACVASTASFASLTVTEFKGFRELGAVGATGLLLAWIATVLVLPAILAAFERVRPICIGERSGALDKIRRSWAGVFGRPFAWVVARAPRTVAVSGVALAVVGFVALYAYVRRDPMEYDIGRLRSDATESAEARRAEDAARRILGYVGGDSMVLLVDRPEDVAPLRRALAEKAAAAGPSVASSIVALEDLVPADQDAKIPILLDIEKKVSRMHAKGGIPDPEWAKIAPYLPPRDLAPIALADLPESLALPFTETDGTRGRIVYVLPTKENTDDARDLLRWAGVYRETKLPDGKTILGTGRAVVYADMWSAVMSALPVAVMASIFAVVIVVMIAFHRGRATLYVLSALAVGVGWMAGLLALFHMKLNFMNFVALPITFGIGVEYAVNIVHRYDRAGRGSALATLKSTGGAVVLCSMTTILGYLALARSSNYAVRSLGYAAVLGEACTLLAAMLVLPAALVWIDGPRKIQHPTERGSGGGLSIDEPARRPA